MPTSTCTFSGCALPQRTTSLCLLRLPCVQPTGIAVVLGVGAGLPALLYYLLRKYHAFLHAGPPGSDVNAIPSRKDLFRLARSIATLTQCVAGTPGLMAAPDRRSAARYEPGAMDGSNVTEGSLQRWSKRWMEPLGAEARGDAKRWIRLERLREVVVARALHVDTMRFAYAAHWHGSGGRLDRAWKNGPESSVAPSGDLQSARTAWEAIRERLCHLCILAREAGSGHALKRSASSVGAGSVAEDTGAAVPPPPPAPGKGHGTTPTGGAASDAAGMLLRADGSTNPMPGGGREGKPSAPQLCDTHRLAWPMLFPVLGQMEPEALPSVAVAALEAVVELAATHRLQHRLGFVCVNRHPCPRSRSAEELEH